MSFRQITEYLYLALSTDTKTIVGVSQGALCTETDSRHTSIFDGTAWFEIENVAVASEHMRVHRGKMWDISALYESVANDANADLVVEVGVVDLHCIFSESSAGAGYGRVYEAPTVTGATGTAATVKNANRVIGDAGAPTVLKGPTITDVGTELAVWYNTGGMGGNATGGSMSRESEIILAPSTKYLFRVTNKKGNAADIAWSLHAYEH